MDVISACSVCQSNPHTSILTGMFFSSAFSLTWTWRDSNIISITIRLHLKEHSSSSFSFDYLNQPEGTYSLCVMVTRGNLLADP